MDRLGPITSSGTPEPSPNQLARRDSSANTFVNNIGRGYLGTTGLGGGVLTLTAASPWLHVIEDGSSGIVFLPVASTLRIGFSFLIFCKTGDFSIVSSGGGVVASFSAGAWGLFTCILASGTTEASWEVTQSLGTNVPHQQTLYDGSDLVAVDGVGRVLRDPDGATSVITWGADLVSIFGSGFSFQRLTGKFIAAKAFITELLDGRDNDSILPDDRKLVASDGSTVNLDWSDTAGMTGNFKDDGSTPVSSLMPVGYIHVKIGGTDSWIPYYQ